MFLLLVLMGILLPPVEVREAECVGSPIAVDARFEGGIIWVHSCKPQCLDGKPRYLVYTNGVATQCETPPACGDLGEDTAETCRIPSKP